MSGPSVGPLLLSVTPEVVDQIAEGVAARLPGAVIPAVIPARIGATVRELSRHGEWRSQQMIGYSACSLLAEWTLNPDGSMHLELKDQNHHSFWRGTFRPVEEK